MDQVPPEALLADSPAELASIGERLREIVRAALPDVIERVRPGWRVIGYDLPLGRRTAFFAWILPQQEHIHLGFVHGMALEDPHQLLQGQSGVKLARWTTFLAGDEPDEEVLRGLLAEAAFVAGLPREARPWRVFDQPHGVEDPQSAAPTRTGRAKSGGKKRS